MIGYYVHHVGQGHAQRAKAVARHIDDDVTALSSLPRPPDWAGEWVQLARDDEGPTDDVTAGGRLHWAPRRHAGLAGRMATLAQWIATARPRALVSDVSVEVALQARLLGTPVVVVALPGERSDGPHQLAFDIADTILAPWPDRAGELCPGLAAHRAKTVHTGGISRFDDRMVERRAAGGPPRVLFLRGSGGAGGTQPQPLATGWDVRWCGPGAWLPDPWPELCAADVVVSHCGLGALADIAAARRPAVLLPDARPHGEQHASAAVLSALGVAVVPEREPADWAPYLDRAARLDPSGWSAWSDGQGAERAAAAVAAVAARA